MRIVLDTNVRVAALLSPYGPCADVLRSIVSGQVEIGVDARIVYEYESVLLRPKFAFDRDAVMELVEAIKLLSILVAPPPIDWDLPDPDDAPFVEVALAIQADCVVTGNLKHFPAEVVAGRVRVLSPADFLSVYHSQP